VLHRLTGIIKNGNEIHFITRGDSCLQEDQPLSREQIAGRVILIEDANGKIREASQLIAKPRYFFNRLSIWFFFIWKRVSNLVMRIFKSDERKG
jgi:hypothetical protein